MAHDLTGLFVLYLQTLRNATPTNNDTTTLVKIDLPNVRAAAGTEDRDMNTDYKEYLD